MTTPENFLKDSEKIEDNPEGERKKFSVFRIVVFCLLGVIVLTAGILPYEITVPHAAFRDAKSIEIVNGLGSRKIGALLKKEGVIRSKWAFVIYVSLRGQASSLKPGTYVFTPLPITEIAKILIQGTPNERAITIPEGWSIKDIAQYLKKEGFADSEKIEDQTFVSATALTKRSPVFHDKPPRSGLEGYLFPDTYRIFKTASTQEVMVKMLDNFDKKFSQELREETDRQHKKIFEMITMASLIEKEVISEQDRALVSGILWKRIAAGIPLQVDATLIYAKKIAEGGTTVSAKVSLADTKIKSLYNTYTHRGLPPGPIASPGLSAIYAALHPRESPYLYYLSTPEGKTIFSKTLDEHNQAKHKYLK